MKAFFIHLLKGLVIGSSMSLPGISGGTTAILLGIYDDLVSAVGSFFKNVKEHFLLLAAVALGGVLGVWLISKPLLTLLDLYQLPMLYLFLGMVGGGLPVLFKKAQVRRMSSGVILYPLLGAAVVVLLWLLPKGALNVTVSGWAAYLVLGLVGLFAAVALVLPGISFTYLLLLIGMYEQVMQAIADLNIAYLTPIAVGLVVGTILTTKVLERCMLRHPQGTYLIIIGFVISSMFLQLFEEGVSLPQGGMIAVCIATFALGLIAVWLMTRGSARGRRKKAA